MQISKARSQVENVTNHLASPAPVSRMIIELFMAGYSGRSSFCFLLISLFRLARQS